MGSEPTPCEKDTEHRMGSARGVREDLLEEVSHELSLCQLSASSATRTSTDHSGLNQQGFIFPHKTSSLEGGSSGLEPPPRPQDGHGRGAPCFTPYHLYSVALVHATARQQLRLWVCSPGRKKGRGEGQKAKGQPSQRFLWGRNGVLRSPRNPMRQGVFPQEAVPRRVSLLSVRWSDGAGAGAGAGEGGRARSRVCSPRWPLAEEGRCRWNRSPVVGGVSIAV